MTAETDERLDLVNERDKVVGRITRAEAWQKRLPVRVVNAFLVGSRGELWIPRRTLSKKMFPGCLDMSVGGHVESGDDYLTCFKRETREELNLDVDTLEWCEIAAFSPFETTLSAFMRVYEIRSDTAPDYFSGGEWLTPAQLLSFRVSRAATRQKGIWPSWYSGAIPYDPAAYPAPHHPPAGGGRFTRAGGLPQRSITSEQLAPHNALWDESSAR